MRAKSRCGRLGRRHRRRGPQDRALRRRTLHHQQPHGNDGRDRRADRAAGDVCYPGRFRQPISRQRYDEVDRGLAPQRLQEKERADSERGSVANA